MLKHLAVRNPTATHFHYLPAKSINERDLRGEMKTCITNEMLYCSPLPPAITGDLCVQLQDSSSLLISI